MSPQNRGMLTTVRMPSFPEGQEERVLTRRHTFLSACFLTISCILPYSVHICCGFSKNFFYLEKLKRVWETPLNGNVMIELLMSRELKWSWKVMKKIWLMFIPPMNFWTFEPAMKPHQELCFLLTMATASSAIFALKGANRFHQPASFICIETPNEVWTLGFSSLP